MTDERLGRIREALGLMLTAERDRWILWLPVALGIGVLFYFALPVEPSFWTGAAGILVLYPHHPISPPRGAASGHSSAGRALRWVFRGE